MSESRRARSASSGSWDRARRAYLAVLGDADPAASLLAADVVDLRLGFGAPLDAETAAPRALVSGPDDLAELRDIVESALGVGTWPRPVPVDGEPVRARVEVAQPAALLALLMTMEDLIERRSPWGKWRTAVDTMAGRVGGIRALTIDLRIVDLGGRSGA